MTSYLWDGYKQLSGQLQINQKELTFVFDYFQKSSMSLHIPLTKIDKVELFRIYNIADKGLRVRTKSGEVNQFILENPLDIKQKITAYINKRIQNT